MNRAHQEFKGLVREASDGRLSVAMSRSGIGYTTLRRMNSSVDAFGVVPGNARENLLRFLRAGASPTQSPPPAAVSRTPNASALFEAAERMKLSRRRTAVLWERGRRELSRPVAGHRLRLMTVEDWVTFAKRTSP